MKFTALASSSAGNLYRVEAEKGTRFIIEAGLPYTDIQKALDYELHMYDFALVTHEHLDHCKGVPGLAMRGMPIVCSQHLADTLDIPKHRHVPIEAGQRIEIEGLTIHAIAMNHSVPTLGFVVTSGQERLAFFTDTTTLPGAIRNVTVLAIEANHDANLVKQGDLHRAIDVVDRHMGIDTAEAYVKGIAKLSRGLREIHLLHLSSTNSHEQEFKRRVQRASGVPTFIAPEQAWRAQ